MVLCYRYYGRRVRYTSVLQVALTAQLISKALCHTNIGKSREIK